MPARARFAVAQPNQNIDWATYRETLLAVDGMEFETFWSFDHLMPIGGDMSGPCHECYTTLAAFAAMTRRVRIGALVSCAIYRNPALQIKMATQIDVISGGRFDFGIGAGWAEREFRAFDLPFPPARERIGYLRETLDLARLMWSGDPRRTVSYEGRYVRANDVFLNPQPVQRPRPPILIGGAGEQLTLRVVARHADIWHAFGDLATLRRKGQILDEYARGYGRDPAEIARSTNVGIWVGDPPEHVRGRGSLISGTPAAIAARLKEYLDAGISYFVVGSPGGLDLDNWRRVSDQVLPRFGP